jgi:poly(A) polymerase Pap1
MLAGWLAGVFSDLPAGLTTAQVLTHVSTHDVSTLRCLNAVRIAHAILRSVPNRQLFRGSLQLIKAWAKQRGVRRPLQPFVRPF